MLLLLTTPSHNTAHNCVRITWRWNGIQHTYQLWPDVLWTDCKRLPEWSAYWSWMTRLLEYRTETFWIPDGVRDLRLYKGGDYEEHSLVACDGIQCGGMLSTFREKVMSYSSNLRTEVAWSLKTADNLYHLIWLDITESWRQVAHYSVCGHRKLDWNCLESFEMWSRWRKEKIIWIGHVKNEEVTHYEGSRRNGISKTQ